MSYSPKVFGSQFIIDQNTSWSNFHITALGGLTLEDTGNAAYIQSGQGDTAGIAPLNKGRIRYNATTQKWQVSENNGAYTDINSGGGGITSLNGLTAAAQTLITGTSGTDFNISSSVSVHTFNIPDAGVGARGLVTTGSQTLAGSKTFSSTPTFSTMTPGSVLFAGASGLLSQDNANLFWDDPNNRLGVGTNVPTAPLQVARAGGTLSTLAAATRGVLWNDVNTAIASNIVGGTFVQEWDPSANASRTITGVESKALVTEDNIRVLTGSILRGGYFEAFYFGAGSISTIRGLEVFARSDSNIGATVSGLTGLEVNALNDAGSTATSVTGASVRANNGGVATTGMALFVTVDGGGWTNAYGITVGTLAPGSATNVVGARMALVDQGTNNTHLLLGTLTPPTGNWSIYSPNSYDTYFASNNFYIDTNQNAGTSFLITNANTGALASSFFSVAGDSATLSLQATSLAGGDLSNITAVASDFRIRQDSNAPLSIYTNALRRLQVSADGGLQWDNTPTAGVSDSATGKIRYNNSTLQFEQSINGGAYTALSGGGITSLNGLTATTQTFATGTSGTDFNIASSVSTHTFNIPDASALNRGLVTTGAQTFAGVKTFTTDVSIGGKLTVTGAIDPTMVLLSGGDKRFGATDAGAVYLAPFTDAVAGIQVRRADNTTVVLDVDTTNQRVGIGNSVPTEALDVTGNVTNSGTLVVAGTGASSVAGNWSVARRLLSAAHANNQGFLLPTFAGTPVAVTGTVEGDTVWDSTNNAFYIYNGTSFQQIGAGSGISGSGTAGQVTYWTGASSVAGDSDHFWDGTGKRLGLGLTVPLSQLHMQSSGSSNSITMDTYFTSTLGPQVSFRHARGTSGTPLATASGDAIGAMAFIGHSGAAFLGATVRIEAFATEAFTASAAGSNVIFQTTPNGSTVRLERMRIDQTGFVNVGPSLAPSALLTVNANTVSVTAAGTTTLHLLQANSATNRFLMDSFAANANLSLRRANGTAAAPTALIGGDLIGDMNAIGHDGVSYTAARAAVRMFAEGSWTGATHSTYVAFFTTKASTTTLMERGRFDNRGYFAVGGTVPTGAIHVTAFADMAATDPLIRTTGNGANHDHIYTSPTTLIVNLDGVGEVKHTYGPFAVPAIEFGISAGGGESHARWLNTGLAAINETTQDVLAVGVTIGVTIPDAGSGRVMFARFTVQGDSTNTIWGGFSGASVTAQNALVNASLTTNNWIRTAYWSNRSTGGKFCFGLFGLAITDHTGGSEDSDFVWANQESSSLGEKMRLTALGTLLVYRYSTDATGALTLYRKARGAAHAPTAVVADDDLGSIAGAGYTSAGAFSGASAAVQMFAREAFTGTAQGAYITFGTTATGTTTRLDRGRIDSTGFWRIGTAGIVPGALLTVTENAATLPAPNAGTVLHLSAADGAASGVMADAFASVPVFRFRRANGTAAAPTALASDDPIGIIAMLGRGATAYSTARVQITGFASQAWTDAAQGTYLSLYTTPNGTTTLTEHFRLTHQGDLQFFGNSNAVSVEVSSAGTGRIRYSDTSATFQVSLNGANYVDLLTGAAGASGVTGTGTNNQVTCWTGTSTIAGFSSFTFDETAGTISLNLSQNANTYFSVTNSNIGASANAQMLWLADVATASITVGSVAAGGRVTFSASDNTEMRFNQAATAPMTFLTATTERMRISSVGTVGIGDTLPAAQLELASPAVAEGRITFRVTPGAHTSVSTETHDVLFAFNRTVTFDTALANQRAFRVRQPTYDAGAGNTITEAVTVSIEGAPVNTGAGSIATALAFKVESGNSRFGGSVFPTADNTYDLGSSALRWALVRATTVTTGDLELGYPESDGEWTIKEGADSIYAINKRTGKKYKLAMEEVP